MNYKYYLKSDIGTTHAVNQDSAFAQVKGTARGKAFLGVVCDGMGGMSAGDYASGVVSGAFMRWFRSFSPKSSGEDIQGWLFAEWDELISWCNNELFGLGVQRNAAMGTTLSALLIVGGEYYIAQLGDSRVYYRGCGSPVLLTRDHSYVMDMVQKGMMTENEATASKQRNILTKCVGCADHITADHYTGSVSQGDIFLLSTDGFHSRTDIDRMSLVMCGAGNRDLKGCILSAIDERKKSGEKDNITALAVQLV